MAEGAAVRYVLLKLADPLLRKALDLYHVSGQIQQMQLELCLIQSLLKDAYSKRNRDASVKGWLNLVRDISYRIEDVIDTFLVEIEENRPKNSRWFNKLKVVVKNPVKLNNLGNEIEVITQKLKTIYQRRTDLGITVLGAEPAGGEEKGHLPFRPTKPSEVDDPEVVGLEADKLQIIKQLLDRNISRRTVLSIVGTGGLGKTTLAQKVYKSAALERQFDCRTWLSISQKFNFKNILREILYSMEPRLKQKDSTVTEEDLLGELKIFLSHKRYLIILDDVWTIDLWERLKLALPDPSNASRVIITSRLIDVAKAADCNTEPYKLHYLNEDDSLALLLRKAFQHHIEPENYPRDLLEVAKRLTIKCDGLPLALVVLGGILTRKERKYIAWSRLEETMDWHNEDGKKCSQILAMSYEDLPYDLKSCFLYFASFPEDYKISGKHVKRMWLAEGFVPKIGVGTIDDRAEEFLQELVQRCLIQITEKSWNGDCKYCSMHDLLRDLVIREATEENFFTVFSKVEEDSNQRAASNSRRVALQFYTSTNDGIYSENTRSLLCFGFGPNSPNDSGFRLLNYSGFRLLRVLTIERVNMREFTCRQWLKDLIHLRYLGFRYCTIGQKLFKKNTFYNLETIDLKGTFIDVTCHPNEWDHPNDTQVLSGTVIPSLRHVYGNRNLERIFPLKWDHHTILQTLKSVGQGEVPKLGCSINNLHTLGIHYWRYQREVPRLNPLEEWQTLKGVLSRAEQLASLRIQANDSLLPFGTDGTKGLPCHEKIKRLHLNGKWDQSGRLLCVPSVEMFSRSLTKLTLVYSGLQEDPMPIFERLQSLRILQLRRNSYKGTELKCSTGGFPYLEKLELNELPKLCHWNIKEGAMPILTHLKIEFCHELHALPELQNVQTLQELLVINPSHDLKERMQKEDLYKIEHIPSVRITRLLSCEKV